MTFMTNVLIRRRMSIHPTGELNMALLTTSDHTEYVDKTGNLDILGISDFGCRDGGQYPGSIRYEKVIY